MSWFLTHGPFDLSLRILHKCDTPPCVNPEHLWIGTQIDNINDMVQKGRQQTGGGYSVGELHPCAKLTEADVLAMRAERLNDKTPYYVLAQKFGVTTMTAHRVCKGQLWTHI
jgi:hypothetical protein